MTAVLLVAVFFLDRSHNTHRWIKLGGFMSFQPSELAKPALILFLAFFLEARTKSMDDWRHTLLPAVIPAFLFAALIMKQPDLGTALVCLGVTAAILYTAGMRLRYFAAGLVPDCARAWLTCLCLCRGGWRVWWCSSILNATRRESDFTSTSH